MKKYLLCFGIVGVMILSTSCKKCYTCKWTSFGSTKTSEHCNDDFSQDQLDALMADCFAKNGTWTAN